MIRIVHTADVHLGGRSDAFGRQAREHQLLVRQAFERCISLTVERQANALLIAGDLFDSARPPQRIIDFVRSQIRRLNAEAPSAHVFVLPGTHDCLLPGGLWQYDLVSGGLANLHCFANPEGECVELGDLGLAVHGRPQACNDDRHAPLKGLEPVDGMVNVALAHGSVQIPGKVDADGSMILPQRLTECGMNYVALGHWHRPYGALTGPVTAWYSGSPEILAVDDPLAGHALVVTLSGPAPAEVEEVRTGVLRVRRDEIDVGEVPSEQQVADELRTKADERLILDVALTGIQPPGLTLDIEQLMEELEPAFFRLRIRDNSQVPMDVDGVPPEQIAGRFVAVMRERLDQARAAGDERGAHIAERALQLGVALLAGKKVLV